MLTDKSYDTSNTEYTSKITNSGSTGKLAVSSKEGMCGGKGDVVIGTIAIECESVISDSDDRHTLLTRV